MARNIMGAFVVEPVDSNHISKLPLNIGGYKTYMLPSSSTINFFCSTKRRRWQQSEEKKVAATTNSTAVATENKKQQPTVPLELTALITVARKSENKINIMKDMLPKWLDGHDDHHSHKGVVLQLVSTQIHTSKRTSASFPIYNLLLMY